MIFRIISTLIFVIAPALFGVYGMPKKQIVQIPLASMATTMQDQLLYQIQDKIYQAFVQSIIAGDERQLVQLDTQLKTLYEERPENILVYWRSYLHYYKAIYFLQKGNKAAAEEETDTGIIWLKNLKHRNAEDYALLAMLYSFSIQFKGFKAVFISNKVRQNIKKALAQDPNNGRAYYVRASSDFYTPEKYGGGKTAEQDLLKVIALPAQEIKNDYLPSWGREEAYVLLTRFYIRKEQGEDAKKYYRLGLEEFPESYNLKQLASQLIEY